MEAIASPKSSIYVVYGGEDYHLDAFVAAVKAWPGRDLRRLNLTESTSDAQVLDLCVGNERGEPVTVLVDDASLVKESKSKLLREYIDNRSMSDTAVVIVAVVRDPKISGLWEYVASKGKLQQFPKLKSFGDGKKNEVLTYIRNRAVKFALSFEDDAAEMDFFRMTNGDLHRINSEFRKLKVLASVTGDGKITRALLGRVVVTNMEAKPYEIADAAFAKNKRGAMNLLSLLYEAEREDEASVMVSAALIRELQSVIVARHLLDKGVTPEEIATVFEMHPWRCKEIFLPRVRKHDQRTLAGLMGRLCRLDSDVKSRSVSKRTLVELAVLSISC